MKKLALILLGIILLFTIFFKTIVITGVALILLVLGSTSLLYRYVIPVSIGFELITLTSLIYLKAFGPILAIIAACLMITISSILTKRFCIASFLKMISYTFAILLGWFFVGNFTLTAIIIIITYNITLTILLLINRMKINPIAIPGNLIFNYLIITKFAPIIIAIL